MLFLFYLFIFSIGAAVGSFLGVVVDRMVNGESIWKGRSHCDHCRHKLHLLDLMPIISFFVLKGKCRYCHKKLGWFYPLIEIVTGLVFVLVTFVIAQGNSYLFSNGNYVLILLYYFSLVSALIAIVFTDIKYGIIPFKVVFFASFLTLIWYLLLPALYLSPLELRAIGAQTNLLNALGTGVVTAGFFFMLFVVTRGRGMGFGDVVYAFLMGFVLGFPIVILALYIAFLSGAVIALGLVLSGRKKFKGGTIPFGPFLVFGTLVGLLWGEVLITYIMGYFMF